MGRLLLWIVPLTFETLPACTEETPARGPTGAAVPVTEETSETGSMKTQTTVTTLMPTRRTYARPHYCGIAVTDSGTDTGGHRGLGGD